MGLVLSNDFIFRCFQGACDSLISEGSPLAVTLSFSGERLLLEFPWMDLCNNSNTDQCGLIAPWLKSRPWGHWSTLWSLPSLSSLDHSSSTQLILALWSSQEERASGQNATRKIVPQGNNAPLYLWSSPFPPSNQILLSLTIEVEETKTCI